MTNSPQVSESDERAVAASEAVSDHGPHGGSGLPVESPPGAARAATGAVYEVDADCPKHGPYRAKRFALPHLGLPPIGPGCPICAAEVQTKMAADRTAAAESARAAAVRAAQRDAHIPARFADRTLDSYLATTAAQQRALGIAQRYVETWADQCARGGSLVLTGAPGTGKTHIACAIGSAVIERYVASVRYQTVLSAMRSIKSTYNRDSEITEQDAMRAMLTPDLLLLDEVGVQFGTEHEKTLLFEILNERYANCRPVVLISNLDAGALEGFLGQRLMDRYRECGVVLAFDWSSHRGESP